MAINSESQQFSQLITEYKRPWKIFSLACGLSLLIWGAYYHKAPDWDVRISFIMAIFTYLTASWSMRVIVERRWKAFQLMLFLTWWSVDGCYWLYWRSVDPYALETMRSANFPASFSLYWICGLIWYFEGTLKEFFQTAKSRLMDVLSKFR
jgi:hypothetical protein